MDGEQLTAKMVRPRRLEEAKEMGSRLFWIEFDCGAGEAKYTGLKIMVKRSGAYEIEMLALMHYLSSSFRHVGTA